MTIITLDQLPGHTWMLVDADSLVYKAGFSNEKRWYETDDGKEFRYKKDVNEYLEERGAGYCTPRRSVGELHHSISNLENCIKKAMSTASGIFTPVYFIGGTNNFREKIYPAYKGHRDPNSKPLHYNQLREHLKKEYRAVVVNGEEVDDRVSWLQYQAEPETTCIMSIDKDLNNTPGWHYNYDQQREYLVTESEADWNFWRQMITGDATDNIPGVHRAGKKLANELLPDELPYWDMEEIVWELYQSRGYDIDYFTLQGQLLWMRREKDEMWTPSWCQEPASSTSLNGTDG